MYQLTENVRTFLKKLVELYRDFSIGINAHKAKVELRKEWSALQKLNEQRYVLSYGGVVLPCFRALELLAPAERLEAEQITDLTLRAIKKTYEDHTSAYGQQTFEEVLRSARTLDKGTTDADIRFGMLMSFSFSEFVLNIDVATEEHNGVRAITVRDGILGYESLADAWVRQIAEIEPRQPLNPASSEFSFMSSGELRAIVERDHAELRQLRTTTALKSRLLLSGALIEGLLLDALEGCRAKALASRKAPTRIQKGANVEDWTLAEMIDVAVNVGRITEGAAKLSQVARDFRNLIHPGKERSKHYVVGEAEVAGAEAALTTVIRDLRQQAKATP